MGLDSPQNTSNVQVETQSDEYDRESAEDGSNDESSGNDGGEHIDSLRIIMKGMMVIGHRVVVSSTNHLKMMMMLTITQKFVEVTYCSH